MSFELFDVILVLDVVRTHDFFVGCSWKTSNFQTHSSYVVLLFFEYWRCCSKHDFGVGCSRKMLFQTRSSYVVLLFLIEDVILNTILALDV